MIFLDFQSNKIKFIQPENYLTVYNAFKCKVDLHTGLKLGS